MEQSLNGQSPPRAPARELDARGSITRAIGDTPLVELTKLSAGLPGRVAVKLESKNPTGSVKDRVAMALVEEAERSGALVPGGTIVAATSGNTGIALAQVGAWRGYKVKLVLPEAWSQERLALLLYLGADVSRTPGHQMVHALARAREIAARGADVALLDQFASPANLEVHRRTTAEEIWRAGGGEIGAFVAGVGTGGTITGVGLGLHAHDPHIRIVAVEPDGSAVLSGGRPGDHAIQGIGAGFVPPLLRRDLLHAIARIRDDEAFDGAQRLARSEGILAGVSSGANVVAALQVAARAEMRGKLVVTVVCDSGERYVTTPRVAEAKRSRR